MLAVLFLAATWVGAWSTAPSSLEAQTSFTNVTLREVVHASIGGNEVQVRFTNRFGDVPLFIAAASVAQAKVGSTPATASDVPHRLTFFGAPSVRIPPHGDVVSDAIPVHVAPQGDLLISLYVPGPTGPPTYHHLAYQHSFAAPGNRVDQQSGDAFSQVYQNWYFLAALEVSESPARGAVVALGDSITNGQGSTIDENDRWSDVLSQRILQTFPAEPLSVLNEAIDGDRILLDSDRFGPSALTRFDDDVVSQSGVRDVILLLGINDIQQSPHQYDASAIEFGLQQIVLRAHLHGIRVIGCTITPYEGWPSYDPQGERTRLSVNRFIRASGVFDGVADFDAVIRDPSDPHRMLKSYDSSDHLHPNASAYKAMANAINVNQL